MAIRWLCLGAVRAAEEVRPPKGGRGSLPQSPGGHRAALCACQRFWRGLRALGVVLLRRALLVVLVLARYLP